MRTADAWSHRTVTLFAAVVLAASACSDDDGGDNVRAEQAGTASASATTSKVEEIAFQGVSQGLTLAQPGGAELRVILEELPGEQLHPDWSPDGSRLAFVQATDDRTWEVWLSDPTGGDARPLVEEYPAELEGLIWDSPAWARDGTQIAMVGFVGNPNFELPTRAVLAIVDVAAGTLSVAGDYSFDGPFAGLGFPRWSPEGDRLAVILGTFDDEDNWTGGAIAVISRSEGAWSEPKVITAFDDFADRPDWHPTDDLIVFTTHDIGGFPVTDEASNLYTVRPDGSELTQITHFAAGAERAVQPTWIQDGRILFVRVSGANDADRSIARVNADGTDQQVLIESSLVGPENNPHPRLRPV